MEEEKLIESKKILTDYMLELNRDIQSAEDWVNTGADEEMYFAIKTVIDELERLQKEFEVLDRECSRLERKEIELEKENTLIKNENVAFQMTHDYDLQMIDEVKGEYVKLYNKLERLQKENELAKETIKNHCSDMDKVNNILAKLQKENEDWQKAYQEEKDEQFNMLTKKCLHCGKNTPLYCEKCYQELITKNAELQGWLELNDYQDRKLLGEDQ